LVLTDLINTAMDNIDTLLNNIRDQLTGVDVKDPISENHPLIYDAAIRHEGSDWPSTALTMIGTRRMDNIRELAKVVLDNNIPGDFIETGVWRGGACIFMAAILKAYNDTMRKVWVCDSFHGLPAPNVEKYPQDEGDIHYHLSWFLAISKETVEENFKKHNLLSPQVQFVKGWFSDTLSTIPAKQFAIVRLDGDMYESTMDSLVALYPKLSPGGFLIVDDFGHPRCKQAIIDYREKHNITCKIVLIGTTGHHIYWQK